LVVVNTIVMADADITRDILSATMKKTYTYQYPHPAVAVDLVILTLVDGELSLLLVERGREPFKGRWALPGGFVRNEEGLLDAAQRELAEETALRDTYLEQIGAFGRPDRDPRERVISIAYFTVVLEQRCRLQAGGDAAAVSWHRVDACPPLAFDHASILAVARERLGERLQRSTLALQFLPAEFTLTELQKVHEAILGRRIDKRNFRTWIADLDLLEPTGRTRRGGQHRPAALYRGRGSTLAMHLAGGATELTELDTKRDAAILAAYNKGYHEGVRALAAVVESARKDLERARK
jgi:8-oxo-dGTP diphosphatase